MFGEFRHESIHSFMRIDRDAAPRSLIDDPSIATLENAERGSYVSLATDRGTVLSTGDLANQFLVFQFSAEPDGPTVQDVSAVKPAKKGSSDRPDALAVLQLTSFHVGTGDGTDKNARATLRLDFGKDEASDSHLDTVFWSIAAGLNLYDQAKNKRSEAKDLKTDFDAAFSGRPIEIPGGLGKLSFEVVKHREPKWWKKVFSFLQSGTGTALTTAIGFPAISTQAIGFVDELLDRLDKSRPEVLFKSRPMTLALTERARDAFQGNVPNVSVGVLNPGFCLIARGRDYSTILANHPVYMGAYGLLKPKDMGMQEFLRDPNASPFNAITYGVIKVGTAETLLNPQLDFRA